MKKFNGSDGNVYERVSRWLTLDFKMVTKRHRLYDFADGGFDGEPILDYFKFKGREYAFGQFIRLDFCNGKNVILEDGSKLSAYDACEPYNPFFLELDERVPAVRLWKQVSN